MELPNDSHHPHAEVNPPRHEHTHPISADMLTVEQAVDRVLGLVRELPVVDVPLLEADGLTLAKDIIAPFDIPSLSNSAMDGYAVRAADLSSASEQTPVTLEILGQIQAGQLPHESVAAGTAIRIMTGAPVPNGADSIVPYEFTDEIERRTNGLALSAITFKTIPIQGEHVRPAGEDVTKGALVLRKGTLIDPPAIGLLASLGLAKAAAIRRPRVAVLATGDEVLEPGTPPSLGRLFDSNSYGVAAALRRWGADPILVGIAKDNMDDLRSKIRIGLEADFLITSAGVSAGAFDMVKEALTELGTMDFWAVKMRPARPLAFGLLSAPDGRQVPHLGLPGNPVSALVALVEIARPAIAKLKGSSHHPLPTVTAVLDDDLLNLDGRRVYARVTVNRREDGLHAQLTGAQGSNLLTSMQLAQGLAICPEDIACKHAGERVAVQLLDWLDHSQLLTENIDITKNQGTS